MKSIVLTESQARMLEEIARETHPFEGCALLLGSVKKDVVEVIDIIPAENRERSTVTFQIDPKIVFEAYQRADREEKEVVGVFHSHPAPPRPSPLDIQYMQVNPVVWLILSTTTNRFEAYQLHDKDIKPVKILRRNTDT
ncbi:MAG: M67 family metallopeptidase [Nitrososphaerales archaeon]